MFLILAIEGSTKDYKKEGESPMEIRLSTLSIWYFRACERDTTFDQDRITRSGLAKWFRSSDQFQRGADAVTGQEDHEYISEREATVTQ